MKRAYLLTFAGDADAVLRRFVISRRDENDKRSQLAEFGDEISNFALVELFVVTSARRNRTYCRFFFLTNIR